MSNVLKFPNTGHMQPMPVAMDKLLRSIGIPQSKREEVVAWAKEAEQQLRVPDITLSINMPEGLAPEQVEHIRRQIFQEFARFGAEIVAQRNDYIVSCAKKMLNIMT